MKNMIYLLFFLSFASASQGATIVNVGGQDFQVEAILAKAEDVLPRLEAQVWWGDFQLASDFAVALGDSLGTPNSNGYMSPSFAYSAVPTMFGSGVGEGMEMNSWDVEWGWVGTTTNVPYDYEWTYAVVSEVPIPAAAWLFGSAILGLGVIKRRNA